MTAPAQGSSDAARGDGWQPERAPDFLPPTVTGVMPEAWQERQRRRELRRQARRSSLVPDNPAFAPNHEEDS